MKNMNGIIWMNCVESTNNETRKRISELDNLSVLSASVQTKGRGQGDNIWQSEDGKNLLLSIVLKFGNNITERFQAYDQFAISQMAALTIVDFLAEHGINAAIKWPNDIYVNEKKICGILIEASIRGEWLSNAIIGIGLNINQKNFDVSIPNPTSLSIETAVEEYDLQDSLAELVTIFRRYWKRYFNIDGGLNRLNKMYLSHLWRKDEIHKYIDINENKTFDGMIIGLSNIGRLVIKDIDTGQTKEYGFKEIGYII